MSNPNQVNVQQLYGQYQNAVRQTQMLEEQINLYESIIDQYRSNLETLRGLEKYPEDGEFIFPISDMVYLKANLSGIKEVLVDVGADLKLPTTIVDALAKLEDKIQQYEGAVERFRKHLSETETIAAGLQNQLSQLSR